MIWIELEAGVLNYKHEHAACFTYEDGQCQQASHISRPWHGALFGRCFTSFSLTYQVCSQ